MHNFASEQALIWLQSYLPRYQLREPIFVHVLKMEVRHRLAFVLFKLFLLSLLFLLPLQYFFIGFIIGIIRQRTDYGVPTDLKKKLDRETYCLWYSNVEARSFWQSPFWRALMYRDTLRPTAQRVYIAGWVLMEVDL